MSNDYTGISFPFRLSVKGGITMSTTSPTEATHIEEGIRQFLQTRLKDRVMEPLVGCEVIDYLFEGQDEDTYTMVKYEVIKALENYDKRVIVDEANTTVYGDENDRIIIELYYNIDKYEKTFDTTIQI